MTDKEPKLDDKHVSLFVEKFRALGLRDRSAAQDVIEILLASFNEDLKEERLEIARTICEILEPDPLGVLVWLNCRVCKDMLDPLEVEDKMDRCFQCRVTGRQVEDE